MNQNRANPEINNNENSKALKYLLFISIFGTGFLVLIVGTIPTQGSIYWQRQLIFSLFLLICFSGMLAALFPDKCLEILQKYYVSERKQYISSNSSKIPPYTSQKSEIKAKKIKCEGINFEGHHPSCKNYENHIISLKNKKYCAGCSGLILGALISIIGILIYLKGFLVEYGVITFVSGISLVVITLYLPLFWNIKKPGFKFLFNVLFVFGAFLGLIGIYTINKNLGLALFYLVLILIWIMTRISISEHNHRLICKRCDLKNVQ